MFILELGKLKKSSFVFRTFPVLTYWHKLGMNYNFIRPDLLVGIILIGFFLIILLKLLNLLEMCSFYILCLFTALGLKTIFCLYCGDTQYMLRNVVILSIFAVKALVMQALFSDF
ncbi:unnamed protein product [Arabidopsis thaliana]|uniref:Uncharacterized protein n=1 Tax=Arabidopsis thaliana TaxID=3702 RepID=A0A654FF72_ARATH|nr:unnamed protein product [Arabidopsis thaliana]